MMIVPASEYRDDVINGFEEWQKTNKLGADLVENWDNLRERFRIIREIYKRVTPEIYEDRYRCHPYFVDWLKVFTPIENNIWEDIRLNNVPMFPQYPVGKYFVDFGDPIARLAVEADGKQHDKAKDIERDYNLLQEGWRVFHIPGAKSYQSGMDWEECEEEDIQKWLNTSSESVIFSIDNIYYGRRHKRPDEEESKAILREHSLLDYGI